MKSLVLLLLPLLLFTTQLLGQDDFAQKNEPAWDRNDSRNFLPVGLVTREQILTLKVYNYNYVEYVPKSDPVQAIHNYSGPLEIKVFFGDWCTDSKKYVSAFIKVMEFVDNANIHIAYINVSRDKTNPADLLAGWNVVAFPTFVVLSNGREVGRIVETPKISIDQDLSNILVAIPQ